MTNLDYSLQKQIDTIGDVLTTKYSIVESIRLVKLDVEELKKLYKDNKIETMIRKQTLLELNPIIKKLDTLVNQIHDSYVSTSSNSKDCGNSNRDQQNPIFDKESTENTIEIGIKEIEKGAENIRKGVEQMGEKMKRDLRINI